MHTPTDCFRSQLVLTLTALACLASCKSTEVNVEGMQGGGRRLIGGAGPALFDSSTDGAPEFDGTVDEEDTALTLGAGYSFTDNWSVEVEYTDFGELAWNGTWLGTPSTGTVESSGLSAALVGFYPIGEAWGLIGRLGLLSWDSEEQELFGGAPLRNEKSGTDVFFGVGAQVGVGQALALRAELNRFEIWGDDVDTVMLKLLYFF